MAYVVTDNCINCKHTECVDICPADAFREGSNFLVIDPNECVDCGLCVPECPEEAIFAESELDDSDIHFVELNADLAVKWPEILESKEPLSDHQKWSGQPEKIEFLVS
ncbi:ferredoxin family protein [Pseudoalteromonas sp. DL2-H2.2]|uniref:Ferredoxin n=1 Tax=Pseudoalteromonas rubra TaxID=43658 RepID=A0A0F4QZC9_9GAMM|nr:MULTISPECIES: ferredoxin FdxA [Pseudoalteromonas]KJZ13036.1 ferredoxin [Pseudoalteromonas rubra]MCF2909103.1 ferredoxin family protein [Pseudoalteromonas sp. DL2-H2.2]